MGAVGGVIQGTPILCGGVIIDTNTGKFDDISFNDMKPVSDCYAHDQSLSRWKFLARLNTPVMHHSCVIIDTRLWITGGQGQNNDKKGIRTTVYLDIHGRISQGPFLPYKMYGHCMVVLEDGKVMILGGFNNDYGVIIYDAEKNTFTRRHSKLQKRRLFSACSLFHSAIHKMRPVVLIVGGYEENSAEVLDYTREGISWEKSELWQGISNFLGYSVC